jgi:protein SCO1/2
VNHDVWWMLTGDKKAIYDFALKEVKLSAIDGEGVDSNFIHTERFVLLDRDRVVRGYYNGLDTMAMANLAADIVKIYVEKDPKKKRSLFRK